MASSPPDSDAARILSVRIVSLDYYMAPPIPGLDLCHSSLHGWKVEEVPVIRVYGSTPAGQKTCLHIHRALPYLYVPCPDEFLQTSEEGRTYMHILSTAIEKALKNRSPSASKRQHVHGCSLVRAKKFYGYHSSEELFVKIYLYYPHEVARAASLLLGGAVLNRTLQPYESHIPYLLQFLIDNNLYGMSHVHTSKFKFRPPLPDGFISKAGLSGEVIGNSSIWLSSTVPSAFIWADKSIGDDVLENNSNCFVRRQSTCSLEVDSSVNDILNEKHKIYTSLSQTGSEVKMVQSLIPIWEEEYERSGMQEAVGSPDPAKPHPEDVLKHFLHGLEYENALSELCLEEHIFSPPSAVGNDKKLKCIESFADIGKSLAVMEHQVLSDCCGEPLRCPKEEYENGALPSECLYEENQDTKLSDGKSEFHGPVTNGDKSSSSNTEETGYLKSLDTEALGLLSWFASSQAVEDVVTDDELVHELILSPLLHTKSYQKALEIAHLDYESASQQECQDILDSVEGDVKSDGLKEQVSCAEHQKDAASVPLGNMIPQVDGSSDENFTTPRKDELSDVIMNVGSEKSSVHLVRKGSSTGQFSRNRRNKLQWGSLPFSIKQKDHVDTEPASINSSSDALLKCDSETGSSSGSKGDMSHDTPKVYAGMENSGENSGKVLAKCSVRDLMRRKRCFRVEQSESEGTLVFSSHEMQENNMAFCSAGPDRHVTSVDISNAVTTCKQDLCTSNVVRAEDIILSKHMCNNDSDIANEVFPETHFNACFQPSAAINADIPQTDDNVSGEKDLGASRSIPNYETCCISRIEEIPLEYNEMTFSMMAPSKSEVDNIPEDFLGAIGHAVWSTDSHNKSLAFGSSFTDSNRQGMNDVLPFFSSNFQDTKPARSFINQGNQESALGVPVHFQNDGQVLYLLTHAFSPPTSDSVHQWLLEEVRQNCLGDATGDNKKSLPVSSQDSLKKFDSGLRDTGEEFDCRTNEEGSEHSSESKDAVHLKPDLSSLSQESKTTPESENCIVHVDTVSSELQIAGLHVKEMAPTNSWHDISQISGPDEKSKLTPLSQIGFRDPASLGSGQQLTLMSMEIHTESRGDLRPDPKKDAINVISLAVQEDASPEFAVYVLMRGHDEEPCRRNVDAVSDCNIAIFTEEKHLLTHFVKIVSSIDPDVLMGWEVQGGSLGFIAERALHLGVSLLKNISRTPAHETKASTRDATDLGLGNVLPEASIADPLLEDVIIEDEWGRTHASGIHVGGRIVLNIWRLMRAEVKLNMYTAEAVAEEVLRRKIPSIPPRVLNHWFSSGPGQARYRCIEYVIGRAKLNLQIINQLDMINRTSELARVFGIDFFSVLSRGSQFRVESMLLRLAHTQNYLAISPGNQQVASQPAMECLPLVMEPESGFYTDPVVVLDFQSLYPSMIIAYNLCFCTCLGKVVPSRSNVLGVSSYSPDPCVIRDLKQQLLLTPNGVMYVPSKVRKGVMPRLLEEILSTRIMVKQAMKKLMPTQQVLQRILNARQLALKLIANVTYGYTAAGFSGRMPCAELADSIVQCGRRTLETAISFVNEHPKWKARVVYGDTDSMFVLLRGRSLKDAFRIGNEIASAITSMNPIPVTLKMEKVYQPCFLLTKKRYVGYSYENPEQKNPIFDAKGIETVRRDTCPAVAKILEQSIRLMFEHQDIARIKAYLQRQWTRILSGKVSLQDFIFAKEVRLGTYSARASSLPPAAIVATKKMAVDHRAEPRYGERIPYVVVHGEPGARLIDMVVDPSNLLDIDSSYRLNDLYYINKQIIPAVQRLFGLLGADLNQWFLEMPRTMRPDLAKRHPCTSYSRSSHDVDDRNIGISKKAQAKRSRIDTYYISRHCTLCGELVQASSYLCDKCSKKESLIATAVVGKTSRLEKDIHHLAAICRHCGGGDWILQSRVHCTSLACSVFFERRKAQKEFQALSTYAAEAGFYPCAMAELF